MTVIFAHRGFSADYPENTLIAYEKAAACGIEGIEIDVQLTKDGEIVVIHDVTVNRTTNGKGHVKDLTLKEIKALNANNKVKQVANASIPTLAEVFEWLTTNNFSCIIELKNNDIPYKGMEKKVIRLIRQFNLSDRIILSSFNHYSLVQCYIIAPEIETAPLYRDGLFMPWIYAQGIKAGAIHPNYRVISEDIIQQSIQNGVKVRPYTINSEKDLRQMFSFGCSAVITDNPAKAIKIRNNM